MWPDLIVLVTEALITTREAETTIIFVVINNF